MTLTERYSRIPYLDHGRCPYGVDCYGLLYLVYKRERNITLPLLGEAYGQASKVSFRNIKRKVQFFADWERVDKPKKWDVGRFNLSGFFHVGICVDDWGRQMMHITSQGGSVVVEDINKLSFTDHAEGWYRYVGS